MRFLQHSSAFQILNKYITHLISFNKFFFYFFVSSYSCFHKSHGLLSFALRSVGANCSNCSILIFLLSLIALTACLVRIIKDITFIATSNFILTLMTLFCLLLLFQKKHIKIQHPADSLLYLEIVNLDANYLTLFYLS